MADPPSYNNDSTDPSRRPTPQPLPKHVSFRRDSSSRPSTSRSEDHASLNARDGTNREKKRARIADMVKADDQNSNENSPLLRSPERRSVSDEIRHLSLTSPLSSPRDEDSDVWQGEEDDTIESKSSWYLFLLTIAIGGLQIAWSVELSNGSPYLLGLGISKSLLAFVWIAGPLSGTLVQPYVGIQSDRCRSRFGKRRPFMVGGAAATIISLMALAWTRELIAAIGGIFGAAPSSDGVMTASIVFAVLMIYVLDFSINVIQAGIRAFIVDNAPTHQQDSANAWASRMSGVGNIIGYLFGYVNLPKYLWFFGDTQFKVLCVIASIALAVTLLVSCISIKERDPRLEGDPEKGAAGVFAFFKGLWHSMRKLPTQIARVCQVQFFAWIGWFPFLFYITTYIGEIYTEPYFEDNLRKPPSERFTPDEIDTIMEAGTRQGTFALLIFALTTFAASVILPFIIASSYKAPEPEPRTPMTPGARTPATPGTPGLGGYFDWRQPTPGTPKTPRTPGASTAGGYFGYHPAHSSSVGRAEREKQRRKARNPFRKEFWRTPRRIEIPWLTLRRAWLLSHVLFFALCWCTFFVRDVLTATVLVALIGIPWAMTNWAPFALIAAEISKRDSIRRGLIDPPPTRDGQLLAAGEDTADGSDQAGVVLGIHNVAIAAPQVIATLVSSAIFKALQKDRGVPGDNSVAWVLRFGGLCALVAAWMTTRVGEESDGEED
ncbi:MFS/sugar transport protein [Teratosphaeria destructans]|uniref:MFS/sugar transport protein n=1 Tax=Teratosphaeria destructans TaxID=418781 RepID=A0A9W7VY42_9PEZI|nr:MFS/sugar transport protein [Teratosphaeria destructans]